MHWLARSHPNGFTLVELLVCLAVLTLMTAYGIPNWQRLQERSRVEVARDQLINDLQTARVRALQRGEPLQLTRLGDCSWAAAANNDWSCGWQLIVKANQNHASNAANTAAAAPFVYRVTAFAKGVIPSSSTVLQAIWRPPTPPALTGQWQSWHVLRQ